jgi:hypothetical protein
MGKPLFANNAVSTLSSSVLATDTTFQLAAAGSFPSPTGGDYFWATLASGSPEATWEVVKVTARSGNTLTVERGQDGTTAKAWSSGTKIELRLTAAAMNLLAALDDLVLHKAGVETMTALKKISFNAANLAPMNAEVLLQLTGQDGANTRLEIDAVGGIPMVAFYHMRGTAASPTPTQSGDQIGLFTFKGRSASGIITSAAIDVRATENFTDAACGSALRFTTTPNGSATNRTVGEFGQDGILYVNYGISSSSDIVRDGAAGTGRNILIKTAGSTRWRIGATGGAESGSNAGSDLYITSYSDAGAGMLDCIQIKRSSGLVTIPGGLSVDATSNTVYGFKVAGSAGGARTIFLAGQSGYSNGFTVAYNGANMQYAMQNGSLSIPDGGIYLSGGSAPLSNYDEGTWTPTPTGLGGTGITYDAKWVRVGNVVHCTLKISGTGLTATAASTTVTGPFTAARFSAVSAVGAGITGYASGTCAAGLTYLPTISSTTAITLSWTIYLN